ncbi:MAG: gamma-glutamyl-gamma-aminobutyrate hydrolase family protein [Lawsonibacter sp.]|jgi:putative glutamine amidotransferase
MTVTPVRVQLSMPPVPAPNYAAAISGAGAIPVEAYAPEPDLSCAGLVLCGGGDLDPAWFGQASCGSHPPDLVRDRAEFALFQAFFQAGKPILGICRGMQVINVALGGTLIQDLSPQVLPFHSGSQKDCIHPIRCKEDSLLHRLYGSVCLVNSSHHQAVDRLGIGLEATAWSEAGFPEGLEHSSLPVLGVQFHPERLSFARRRPDAVDGASIFFHFLALCRNEISLYQ